MPQFVGGVMVGLHVNSGQALRLDQWSKSHYQVMNVGKVVGKGDLLPLAPSYHTCPSPLTPEVSKRPA